MKFTETVIIRSLDLLRFAVCESRVAEKEDLIRRLKEQHNIDRRDKDREHTAIESNLEQLKLASKCEVVRLEDRLAEAQENILQ